jgi:hypothetical protein
MERATNLIRTATLFPAGEWIDPLDLARGVVVLGCAFALIMAGPVWPF